MTSLLSRNGSQAPSLGAWNIAQAYTTGDTVTYNNAVYQALVDVPANTAWSTSNFTKTVNGMNLPSTVMMPTWCEGFGRLHAYGNRIYRSGSGAYSPGRIFGMGQPTSTGTSNQLYPQSTVPASWTKIQVCPGNFFGLGSNGILYAAGNNAYGALGNGTVTGENPLYAPILYTGRVYGTGIQVLNFWATDNFSNPADNKASVIAHVTDNGVLKSYAWGYNGYGLVGNGTSTDTGIPTEIVPLRGKSIVAATVNEYLAMVVTSTGEVWGAGVNGNGQLGTGATTNAQTVYTQALTAAATPVVNATDVKIAYHTGTTVTGYILQSTGKVLASGGGADGRLGDGNLASHNVSYYAEVKKAAATPLTNITKIQARFNSLVALDSSGTVWWTGTNWNGQWGNGEVASYAGTTTINGYATAKMYNIKDFWYVAHANGYGGTFYLTTANELMGAGVNTDYRLGVKNSAIDADVPMAEKVVLPPGEYPVAIVPLGGTSYLGTQMLSNTNKLYIWGDPGAAAISPVYGLIAPRWPLRLIDFYDDIQTL